MLPPFEQESHEIPEEDPKDYSFPPDFDLETMSEKIADHVMIRVWRYLVDKPEMQEVRSRIINQFVSLDVKLRSLINPDLLYSLSTIRSLSSTRLNYLDQYAAKKIETGQTSYPIVMKIPVSKFRGVN